MKKISTAFLILTLFTATGCVNNTGNPWDVIQPDALYQMNQLYPNNNPVYVGSDPHYHYFEQKPDKRYRVDRNRLDFKPEHPISHPRPVPFSMSHPTPDHSSHNRWHGEAH